MHLVLYILFIINIVGIYSERPRWQWHCENKNCLRKESLNNLSCTFPLTAIYPSIESCRISCGDYGALWPKPTGRTTLSSSQLPIYVTHILTSYMTSNEEEKSSYGSNINISLAWTTEKPFVDLDWHTQESYTLIVSPNGPNIAVDIFAENIFGTIHGLQSLSQLISVIECNNLPQYMINSNVFIEDKPMFTHRGLLIDTGRNFLSKETIRRQIDAMATTKLNVLHWHITDSQNFPFESKRVPNLSKYGAYAYDKIYTSADILELKDYAIHRGIRILVEIDAPAHAGNGWQWGSSVGLGNLAVCVNQNPWRNYCIEPPCGQLNPVNENLYPILGDLYKDIQEMFPKQQIFHMGGDEVSIKCWNATGEIKDFLLNQGFDLSKNSYLDLWGRFQAQALNQFDLKIGHNTTKIILWSSDLTDPKLIQNYLSNERYVIQTWVPYSSSLPKQLIELNYTIIVSTKDAWYLDHGFWASKEYHDWKKVYNNKILTDPAVLGGEVCSWGEVVDDQALDSRIWPRAAAAAERLWTNPDKLYTEAYGRFQILREDLVRKGIRADAVSMQWCVDNEGQCV